MSDSTDDKAQEIANAQPDRQGQMGPDMSDTFEMQAALLPEENVNAEVKSAPADKPDMTDEHREEAQDAKLDVMSGDRDSTEQVNEKQEKKRHGKK
jgi:hypothetical protein